MLSRARLHPFIHAHAMSSQAAPGLASGSNESMHPIAHARPENSRRIAIAEVLDDASGVSADAIFEIVRAQREY